METSQMKVRLMLYFITIAMQLSFYNTAPTTSAEFETTTIISEDVNGTNELFVIREVVYEVGILTDDNSTLPDEESHENVAVTFYNPEHNDTFFNFSNIPVPVQTNVSGHVITGLAPLNLGSLKLPISNGSDPVLQPPSDSATNLPLQNSLVSVTTNLTTSDPYTGSKILQGLPPLLALSQFPENTNVETASSE